MLTIGKKTISWKSCKQDIIADSMTKVEYIAAYEAAKEAIWIRVNSYKNMKLFPL